MLAFGMVGITRGQTARLNVVNIAMESRGSEMMCQAHLMFFDSMGNMLAEGMVNLMPGHAMFHDLNGDGVLMGREGMRAQIRADVMIIGDQRTCNVIPTLEIFDNATGMTNFVLTNPTDDGLPTP